MLYKTIVLELLQQRPEIYDHLLENRTLLQTLNLYASQLREFHLAWKSLLSTAKPNIDPVQIASEATELALQELEACLSATFSPDETGMPSIEGAMEYLRAHTPPA